MTAQAFIKEHHYLFIDSIGKEVSKIKKIMDLQARHAPLPLCCSLSLSLVAYVLTRDRSSATLSLLTAGR